MADGIKKALDYVESNVSYAEKAIEAQCAAWRGEKRDIPPLLLSCPLTEEQNGWLPEYNYKEIHFDSEKMLASELRKVLTAVNGGYGAVPSVRANMGCGIIPTLFGIKQELFEDKMPWIQQRRSKEEILKMGPEDLTFSEEFKAGLEHMVYMEDKLKGTGCGLFPMDIQGPFDTAHLVYGDDIFYDLYDDPEFVHHLMALSCQAIFIGMGECMKIIADSVEGLRHYNNLYMPQSVGGLKLSEDTSTLLSKGHVQEFVAPYTSMVLSRYRGGYIHYCGKNEHLYREVMDMPLAYGINFGNPDMHDMADVLKDCAASGKIYYGPIPRQGGETLDCYFSRCVSDAMYNDKIHLLLAYNHSDKDAESVEEVQEAWGRVCARAFA